MADHDQRLKTLLHEFFAEFLRLALPDWADRFDLGSVEWLEQEVFPDPPQGQRRAVDLVARLTVRQEAGEGEPPADWITLVHVEIESEDTVQPLRGRMAEYYWYLRHKLGLPVLPVALYLRVGLDGLGWDTYEEWFLDRRLVHFEYAYVGLPGLEASAYLHGENWLAVALAGLMRLPEGHRWEVKADALQRLATSPVNEWQRFLLCECLDAYLPLEGPQLADYEHLLRTEPYKEAQHVATTTFEKGISQGIAQGQRQVLKRQLEQRFGPLSETARARLESWSSERLDALAGAVLTASSLRDLGLED